MPKRSTRFYRKNEAEVMKRLGFRPTKNSGAGWIDKEDGQNDQCICQLKSTDAMSISIKQNDLHVLENNASISHKLPVFAFQFLNTGETWVAIKPEHLSLIQSLIRGEDISEKLATEFDFSVDETEQKGYNAKCTKRSNKSLRARSKYYEEKQKEAERRKQEWKNNSNRKV